MRRIGLGGEDNMHEHRAAATAAGILYISGTVAGVLSVVVSAPVRDAHQRTWTICQRTPCRAAVTAPSRASSSREARRLRGSRALPGGARLTANPPRLLRIPARVQGRRGLALPPRKPPDGTQKVDAPLLPRVAPTATTQPFAGNATLG
jgi:hypothetical protein